MSSRKQRRILATQRRSVLKSEQLDKLSYHGSGVIVRNVGLPYGNSLFATRHFNRGDIITEYAGDLISAKEAKSSSSSSSSASSHYRTLVPQHSIIDGMKSPLEGVGAGSFANHHDDNNASFLQCYQSKAPDHGPLYERKGMQAMERIFIIANRDIGPGMEICVDYGQQYWNQRETNPVSKYHFANGMWNIADAALSMILSFLTDIELFDNFAGPLVTVRKDWCRIANSFKVVEFPITEFYPKLGLLNSCKIIHSMNVTWSNLKRYISHYNNNIKETDVLLKVQHLQIIWDPSYDYLDREAFFRDIELFGSYIRWLVSNNNNTNLLSLTIDKRYGKLLQDGWLGLNAFIGQALCSNPTRNIKFNGYNRYAEPLKKLYYYPSGVKCCFSICETELNSGNGVGCRNYWCDKYICEDEYAYAYRCSNIGCDAEFCSGGCPKSCSLCYRDKCDEHIYMCESCGKSTCDNCGIRFYCFNCNESICSWCHRFCKCGQVLCRDCPCPCLNSVEE